MNDKELRKVVPADSSQWSEKSKRTLYYDYIKEYKNIEYNCWHCQKASVFSADDQKYTYEIKKAHIDQRRILCPACWTQLQLIQKNISMCKKQWAESKDALKSNSVFLNKWLQLLIESEGYVPYKPNTATKNMLNKLLNKNA